MGSWMEKAACNLRILAWYYKEIGWKVNKAEKVP